MSPYQHVATYGLDDNKWLSAISDLEIVTIDDQSFLFTITQQRGGGVTAYKIDRFGAFLTRLDSEAFPNGTAHRGDPEIAFFDNSVRKYLYLTNLGLTEYLALNLSDQGQFNGYSPVASPQQFEQVSAFGQFKTSAGSFIYSAFQRELSFHIANVEPTGRLKSLNSTTIPLPFPHPDAAIDRIFTATNGEKQYIVAISGLGDFIATYEITDTGQIAAGSLHTGNMGVGYRTPTDGVAVEVDGKSYVVVAAARSSTLSVLQLEQDGKLKAVDHVPDELTTRFERVTAIDSVILNDRAFIFVGGVDDGISVFTLQPNGVLLHLTTIEDTAATTLNDVSDITANINGNKIEVYVSSASETGITHFRFDPGKIGETRFVAVANASGTPDNDLLIAGKSTKNLNAGDGDDILVSGENPVRLSGGPGRDIFVPTQINGTISILDFEPGKDRLDFSQLNYARSIADLKIKREASSAVIQRFDSKIKIQTKDNVPLFDDDITNSVFSVSHYNVPEQKPIFLPRPTAEELLRPYLFSVPDRKDEQNQPDPLEDAHPPTPTPSRPTVIEPETDGKVGSTPGPAPAPAPNPAPPPAPGPNEPLPNVQLGPCFDLTEDIRKNVLLAIANDDIKSGTSGNDTLRGDLGHDVITGGSGQDVLTGGSGQDMFVFNLASDSPSNKRDMITDFKGGEDIINLRKIDLGFINNKEFTGASQLRWYAQNEKLYVQADINGDKIADLEIILIGSISLSESDFLL